MMVAAMEGAMAFQKGLGACHALAHALTPISGVHHGLANAIVLPVVMEFNRPVSTARLARVAVAMGDTSQLARGGARGQRHRAGAQAQRRHRHPRAPA